MSEFSEILKNKLKNVSTADLEKALTDAITEVTKDKIEISITDIKFGNHLQPSKLCIDISHSIDLSWDEEKDV